MPMAYTSQPVRETSDEYLMPAGGGVTLRATPALVGPKPFGGLMLKSLVLGAILGGLTAFIWSFISWSFLPWHQKQLRSFQNEDEVSAVIASHAPESGNYLLPAGPPQHGLPSAQTKSAEEIRMQKMQKRPMVFAAIRREGFSSFPRVLLTQLLCQMFAALLLTCI